jgi:cell division protein FtsI/penicillin-binding protein 2
MRRLFWVTIAGLVAWAGLLARAFIIQVLRNEEYAVRARAQHESEVELPASRGRIFDRHHQVLALNESGWSVYILPQHLKSQERGEAAQVLSSFGLGGGDEILRRINREGGFFWFARKIDYELGLKLTAALKEKGLWHGVVVVEDAQRVYPWGEVAASLLGFVGEDGGGLSGIEYQFDGRLRGEPGRAVFQKDPTGTSHPYPSYPYISARPGQDLELTVDIGIQELAYNHLKRMVDSSNARQGMVIVLSVSTAEVLALVEYPDFDPQSHARYPEERYKIASISDEFEPGSSFKHVIAACCLERSLVAPQEVFDLRGGYTTVSGHRIRDVRDYGRLDFEGIFVHSSNVGVVKLARRVEPKAFYEACRRLGFGAPTGIELPGEARGYLDPPDKITPLRLANMAFGQGLRVTGLQLAASYLSIANDGVYLKPYIIQRIIDDGKVIYEARAHQVRRAVPDSVAHMLKSILARVVSEGTGKAAAIPGFEVCGKTGTGQKPGPDGYSSDRVTNSFIGFLPADEPQYLICLVLDEPNPPRYAAELACPLFKEIAEAILTVREYSEAL